MTNEELQAIAERHAKTGPWLFSANHEIITLALADIPTLLEAVKELTAEREAVRKELNAGPEEDLPGVAKALFYRFTEADELGMRLGGELDVMTARCERLEGVIEQFIDSFKQVWMTSAMERAFNAGLEALRDEPTGSGT